jgi:hypothetical protein
VAAAPLVPKQIEPLFQALTMTVLGTDDPSAVRIGWQTQGQPATSVDVDVVYVRCVEDDDDYNRIRDLKNVTTFDVDGTEINQQIVRYTRVWKCFWVAEGPNSFDNMRQVKSALLTDQATHDTLAQALLFLITDMPTAIRLPEVFPGNQWGERVDFEARFNEQVTEITYYQSVKSAEVIVLDQDSTLSDPAEDIVIIDSGYGSGPYGAGGYGA